VKEGAKRAARGVGEAERFPVNGASVSPFTA
jgi:hypothetical protein